MTGVGILHTLHLWEHGNGREYALETGHFPWRNVVLSIFGFALLTRLAIAGAYLNAYDTEWNIMWGIELQNGFYSAYTHVTSLDYPPLYLYPLSAVGRLMAIDDIAGYPPFRMVAIKFLPCLTDSLTCVVLYRLGSKRARYWGAMAAALWAVNPATIFNCAFWGQTDCVLLCLAAMLFVALGERRVVASGILFAAMCATKLQGLYLAPVVGMEMLRICFGSLHYRKFKLKQVKRYQVMKFLRFAGAVMGTLAVIYLPFMIGGAAASHDRFAGFFQPLTVYSGGVDKYPYITMNADNLYMLLGMNGVTDDTHLLLGLSASLVGNFFLLASVAAVSAVYVCGKRQSHWLTAYLMMESVFMLTCRQHERYQILTLVMLMGAFLQLADKRLFTVFSLQSAVIFFNQARVLGVVQEHSAWWEDYQVRNYAMDALMRESRSQVMQRGAWWVRYSGVFSFWNALGNVCLMAVSLALVLRYFYDDRHKIPFLDRVGTWWNEFWEWRIHH